MFQVAEGHRGAEMNMHSFGDGSGRNLGPRLDFPTIPCNAVEFTPFCAERSLSGRDSHGLFEIHGNMYDIEFSIL